MAIREFALERAFARWEFRATHLLSASDCEALTVAELLDFAGVPVEALTGLKLGYTDSQGAPELRARIARFYPGLSADDIVVTNGPQEAIFLAMTCLLDEHAGDRVVVQTPCYQSLAEIAVARGCDVARWDLVETATGWRLDLERLDALLTRRTKLLVVNAPHNPTGHLPAADERAAIVALCAERGVRLFSDEMYRGLERADGDALVPAASVAEDAISLWGMSKSFGLAGLRIGWLALRDRRLRDEILRLKDYTTICATASGEFLAGLALDCTPALIARNRGIIEANLRLARESAAGAYEWREPLAGPVAFVRLPGANAASFAETAVEQRGVMVVHSALFDAGDAHIRLGLGRRAFPAALAATFPAFPSAP